jgi:hypothetical protein
MATSPSLARPAVRTEAARPLLSLTLATYNRERYLEGYLTHHITAFEAAGIDYELVVSDNCSTDGTAAILARFAARHKAMRVVRQRENIGAHNNILFSFHEARGEIVVNIADDDMMVPHQLLAYVRRMQENPSLVMVQAPWFLVDETQGGAITGKFYDFPADQTFARGSYAQCLQFMINHHVFPECWLLRTRAVPQVIGLPHKFAYNYINKLTRALGLGDVLFSPDPHIAATAVAKGDNQHVGNHEVMEAWDNYRGALELLASHARQFQPGAIGDVGMLATAIQSFTIQRMAVAARFQAAAGNWSNCWHIQRRIHAYGGDAPVHLKHEDVAKLAAVETALAECARLGAARIIVDDRVSRELLAAVKRPDGVPVTHRAEAAETAGPTVWCVIGSAGDLPVQPGDRTYDLLAVMHRFPALG